MFNSLSTGSFLGTGTVFREASFSWRRGHFLLSQYPFFVLFHSCLRVLHAHWQCGLLARPFNPTLSASLLYVSTILGAPFCSHYSPAEFLSNVSPAFGRFRLRRFRSFRCLARLSDASLVPTLTRATLHALGAGDSAASTISPQSYAVCATTTSRHHHKHHRIPPHPAAGRA